VHGSSVIHNNSNVNSFDVQNALMPNLLPQYSAQAEKLRAVFAGATIGDATLAAKYTALAGYESAIKTAGNGVTLPNRVATVGTQRDNILTEIFGAKGTTDRDAFDAYFELYAVGNRLITRDWQTEYGVGVTGGPKPAAATAAEGTFAGLLSGAGEGSYPISHTWDNYGRGTALNVGNEAEFNALCGRLVAAMTPQIVAKLGFSGANANEVAKALIIQLGQDHEEFKAFINDLEAETGCDSVLGYTGFTVASAGSQSNEKLAAVNPGTTFNPEELKGNKLYEQYTGNFHPYKKEDNGIA
jgi:type II secretory pathway pseudopilin PulG